MFYLETYKLFKRKLVWVVLLGTFLLIMLQEVFDASYFLTDELQQVMNIFEKYKGTWDDLRIEQFWNDYMAHFSKDILFYKNYFFIGDELRTTQERFSNIDFNVTFGFFEGWQDFLTQFMSYMRYIPIFIGIAFSPIFSYDNTCGMKEILLSTKNGRKKSTKAKIVLAFLMTNLMFLLIAVIPTIRMFVITGGTGWDTSIQATSWLEDSPLNINYGTLSIHTFFLSFLAINIFLLITLAVSILARSPFIAMCVSLGILYVVRPDAVAAITGVSMAQRIVSLTPLNAMNTYGLAALMPIKAGGASVHWIYIVEIVYVVLLIVGGILFYKVLTKHQKYYAS